MGECTGISFTDSTLLRVCDNRRIHSHKVFDGIAQRGKCSLGWFYEFKLHLIVNDMGQIINFMITLKKESREHLPCFHTLLISNNND